MFFQKQKPKIVGYLRRQISLFVVLGLLLSGLFSYTRVAAPEQVEAATSSNLNIQARLYNSTGSVVPDGYYNIEFKMYDAVSSGSLLWTETWYDSNGVTAGNDNRVRVVNGYMSVQLGSQTSLPSVNWDDNIWISLNVGDTTQTASPTWDGEMSPRIKLTAVPFALAARNVSSGNTSSASTDSGNILIQSGNATGATSNSGNISLDVGTATGTAGTISVGNANTSGITIGRVGVLTDILGNLTVSGSQFTNNGSTLNGVNSLGDFPSGGNIGSASTTVDVDTAFAISQTTAGQTISLPDPTTSAAGRIVYVLNNGSASFTMHGVTIPAGYGQIYIWNGSSWKLGASGGGAAITLQSGYDGGNTITTTDARDIDFTLADTSTDANFLVNIASGSTGEFKIQSNGTDVLQIGSAGQLQLDAAGDTGGILLGGDANLYRSASNTLKTDDNFSVGSYFSVLASTGQVTAGSGTSYTRIGQDGLLIRSDASFGSYPLRVTDSAGNEFISTYLDSTNEYSSFDIHNPYSGSGLYFSSDNSSQTDNYLLFNAYTGSNSFLFTQTSSKTDSVIGSSDGTSSLTLRGGSGSSAVSIQAEAGGSINVGTVNNNNVTINGAAVAGTTIIGGTSTTGTITVGRSTATNTISIGSAIGSGGTQTINIGTSSSLSSTTDVNIGSQQAGTTAISGNLATRKGTDYSTVAGNNAALGNASLVRLTGASAQTITGIASGTDGRRVTLLNASGFTATISNNSVSSSAANRITTGTGADISLLNGSSIELIYDSTDSLWRVTGSAGFSTGNFIQNGTSPQTADFNITGDGVIGDDLAVNGQDLTTSQTTFNLLNTTATTINAFGAATAINLGSVSGSTITGGGELTVQSGGTNTAFNLNSNGSGNIYIGFNNTGSSNIVWIGNTDTVSQDFYLGASNSSASSQITVGNVGQVTLRSSGVSQTTVADTIRINAVNNNAATLDVRNSSNTAVFQVGTDGSGVVIADDLAINGGNLTTNDTTFNLLNTTATTINAFGAATTLSLGAGSGTTTINNNLTVTGLLTANGNLTLQTGDTFTINGDALTDLTGSGLIVSSNALTVDATSATGFIRNGGNTFSAAATIGTNDSNVLNLETNNTTRFQIASGLSSLTGQGNTYINSSAGVLYLGNSSLANGISLGTGNASSNTINIGGAFTGAPDATSLSLQASTSINLGTSGVSTTVQIGNTTGAVSQTINIGNNSTASSTNNVNIGSQQAGTTAISGNLATRKGTDYSTVAGNNAALGNASLVRLTGASAQTITGIASGTDGRRVTLLNASGFTATISNNSVSSSAANRITTGTGADISLLNGSSIELIYDSTDSLWRVTGSAGFSTGNFIQNGITQQTSANFNIQSASSGDIGAVIQGASGQAADILQLKDGVGDNRVRVLPDSGFEIRDSDTFSGSSAFSVLEDGGTAVFRVSTDTPGVHTDVANFNVFNTTATTINAFGAATTISIGASSGTTTVNNNLTVTGLLTANGDLTLQTGDTFTINGDALTDLTGSGLIVSSNALTVDATSATGFFRNGGNSFAGAATLGTNDGNVLNLETNNTNRFQLSASASTLTGQGTTILNSTGSLTVQAAGTNILALNTAGAGTVNLGTTNSTTIGIGNTTAATAVTIQGGTSGSAINIQAAASGSINIGTNNVATKTVNIGSTAAIAQNTTVHIADSSAGVQTVTIGSTSSTSATNIQGGTSGSINIGSVGSSTTASTINISNTSNATGIQGVNIGSTANASSTTILQAGSTNGIRARADGTNSFRIQSANGSTTIFNADVTNTRITIGSASGSLSGRNLEVASVDITTTLRIGDGTNGISFNDQLTGKLRFRGTAQNDISVTLTPEYPGAVLTGDGSNNVGVMTSDFCSGSSLLSIGISCGSGEDHNYYSWTASAGNDYDIFTKWQVPSDFASFGSVPVQFYGWKNSAGETVQLRVYKSGSATVCDNDSLGGSGLAWTLTNSDPTTSCSISAGDILIFRITLAVSVNSYYTGAGEIFINYKSQF